MTLRTFLDARRVAKAQEWNVTGMGANDMGRYDIATEDYDEFLKHVYEYCFVQKKSSSLLERHTKFTPLLIDLDFKYALSPGGGVVGVRDGREFTKDNVRTFVRAYADAFAHFFQCGVPLRFFVQLKSAPAQEKGWKKDGIHIVCPDVSVPYEIPFTVRKYLLEQDIIGKCFANLANDPADVFDEAVIQRNNWFLYGASKPDKEAYKVAYCFESIGTGELLEHDWPETEEGLVRLFSIRNNREAGTELSPCADTQEEWRLWTSIANQKPGSRPKGVSKSVGESVASNKSDSISKLLRMTGTWDVVEMDNGFRLRHDSNHCLVADVEHSKPGHSCVYVHARQSTMFCFSHASKRLTKSVSTALWNLLAGTEENELIDDVYACKRFVSCLHGELKKEGDVIYVFDPETGMWESNETTLIAAVHRHKNELVFDIETEEGRKRRINYGGVTKHMKNMFVHLKAILPNESFLAKTEATLPYLLFADGIFHIPSQTFAPGFDKNKVFLARINRPFPLVRNRELEKEIDDRLFTLPFTNKRVGEYLKMRIARSIAGCYQDKKFICALGDADSSKGTLTKALRNAFGGYVVEWNANHLKYSPHSGQDEAKKLAWIFKFEHARFALSNEARMDKTPLDGNLIKTLSSGGDEMAARRNFADERPVVLRASFLYLGNDLPDITPKDSGLQTRLRMIRYTKRFVANPSGPNECLADPTIKTKVESREWADSLFWLLMDAYALPMEEPTEVLEETKEWVPAESAKFREMLEQSFSIDVQDMSDENYTASRDIISCLKAQNLNWSDTKIGRELTKLGLVKEDKKIEGKTIKIWRGIS